MPGYDIDDLRSFGKYLLSYRRRARFLESDSEVPLYDRLLEVHDADIRNWLEEERERDRDQENFNPNKNG